MSPLKLFEYMAAGKPFHCSILTAAREVVDGGDTAIRLPTDAAAWTATLRRLPDDPGEQERLGHRALANIHVRHTWRQRLEAVLAPLVAEHGD